MLESLLSELPVDVSKLKNSPEFERLLKSLLFNIKQDMKNPDSSIGLALNAAFVQLTEKDSIVMNEANFTFLERQLISRVVGQTYETLKG